MIEGKQDRKLTKYHIAPSLRTLVSPNMDTPMFGNPNILKT